MRLYKIGMAQNALCKVCEEKNEGILHLFLNCTELEELMVILKKIVPMLMGNVGEEEINWNEIMMFGINVKCKNRKVINVILALAKYSIWSRRNIVK